MEVGAPRHCNLRSLGVPRIGDEITKFGVSGKSDIVDNGGWSRYFGYDQYSNMWLCGWPGIAPNGAAPTANYCSQTPSNIFNTANQIIGRSYDAAGNMASLMGS